MYVSIRQYTLNIYNDLCPLYLNKTGGKSVANIYTRLLWAGSSSKGFAPSPWLLILSSQQPRETCITIFIISSFLGMGRLSHRGVRGGAGFGSRLLVLQSWDCRGSLAGVHLKGTVPLEILGWCLSGFLCKVSCSLQITKI